MNKVQIFPNLLTMGNLCCGLLAMAHLYEGTPESFTWAATLILIAMIFDALDGHVARLTKSASQFGVNFDSLADLVTFGVAPAMLVFRMIFPIEDNIGTALIVVYAGCTALRLARFNTTATTRGKKPDFMGLPCPAAAAAVASLALCAMRLQIKYGVPLEAHLLLSRVVAVLLILLLSALMVSKVPYPSIARLGMSGQKPFYHLVVAMLLLALGVAYLPIAIFLVTMTYVGYGLEEEVARRRRRARLTEPEEPEELEPAKVP